MQHSNGNLSHRKHRSIRFHSAPGWRPLAHELRELERRSERKRRKLKMYASMKDLMKAECR